MAYTAYTLLGPRVTLALSKDLFTWERLGLLHFSRSCQVDFSAYGDKDGLFFPDVVLDEEGAPTLALIHRPTYHVSQVTSPRPMAVSRSWCRVRYAAGVMILSAHDPRQVLYCSARPLLIPEIPEEQEGIIANVIFPTGIDQRPDTADPEGYDVYYGMADTRIGVARLHVPPTLPPASRPADNTASLPLRA